MDESRDKLASWLGVDRDHLHFGPSTSQNTYVLAQAVAGLLTAGDEIVVTNQDHEANSGVWRRLATRGVVLREWSVDPGTGHLDPARLPALLNARTRLVVFPHCSNILAEINPVSDICHTLRATDAISVVDGVGFAGHGFPDLGRLGADIYLFSTYKTYGPHQGIMVMSPGLARRLAPQGHDFNADYLDKRLVPAGPDHAQVAACAGIADYFDLLHGHHDLDANDKPAVLAAFLRQVECELIAPLVDFCRQHPRLRLLGPEAPDQRAPTLSLVPTGTSPQALAGGLAKRDILAGAGHFYAPRLLRALDLDPQLGVLRLSLLHYNSTDDVAALSTALTELLPA